MEKSEDGLQTYLVELHKCIEAAQNSVRESESLGASWPDDRTELHGTVIPDLRSILRQLQLGRGKIHLSLERHRRNQQAIQAFPVSLRTNPGYWKRYWRFLSVRLIFLMRYVTLRVIFYTPLALIVSILVVHGSKFVLLILALFNLLIEIVKQLL